MRLKLHRFWYLQEVQNEILWGAWGGGVLEEIVVLYDTCEHVKNVGLGLLAGNWLLSRYGKQN